MPVIVEHRAPASRPRTRPRSTRILNEMRDRGACRPPTRTARARSRTTSTRRRTRRFDAHVSGPLPPLRRPRQQPRLVLLHADSSPSCGSASSTQRFNPVVEHFLHQAGRHGPAHLRAAVRRAASRHPRRDRHAVHATRSAWRSASSLTAEDYEGRPALDGHPDSYGIMSSADIASLTRSGRGSCCCCPRPPRSRTSPTRSRADGKPLGDSQGRSMRNLPDPYGRPRGRSSRCSTTSRPAAPRRCARRRNGRSAGRWTTSTASPRNAHRLAGRAVRLRAPGGPAGPVRRLRDAQGARAGAGRDRPRDGAVHRRRQDATPRAPSCSTRGSRSASGSTRCWATRPTRRPRPARRAR